MEQKASFVYFCILISALVTSCVILYVFVSLTPVRLFLSTTPSKFPLSCLNSCVNPCFQGQVKPVVGVFLASEISRPPLLGTLLGYQGGDTDK